MRTVTGVLGALATLLILAPALPAQEAGDDAWRNRWIWGGQTGLYFFQTPTQDWEGAFEFGGHWLITRDRVGLHLGFDQIFFASGTTSVVPNSLSPNGFNVVQFDNAQRIQASLYALPMRGQFQLLLGGGVAIHKISDAEPIDAQTLLEFENAFSAIATFDTKAFPVISGGAQWSLGRWALFGNYQFMPSVEPRPVGTVRELPVHAGHRHVPHQQRSARPDRRPPVLFDRLLTGDGHPTSVARTASRIAAFGLRSLRVWCARGRRLGPPAGRYPRRLVEIEPEWPIGGLRDPDPWAFDNGRFRPPRSSEDTNWSVR